MKTTVLIKTGETKHKPGKLVINPITQGIIMVIGEGTVAGSFSGMTLTKNGVHIPGDYVDTYAYSAFKVFDGRVEIEND